MLYGQMELFVWKKKERKKKQDEESIVQRLFGISLMGSTLLRVAEEFSCVRKACVGFPACGVWGPQTK